MNPRTALVIDLDNVVIDGDNALTPLEVGDLLRKMLDLLGPVEYSIVAAPRKTVERYGSTLAALRLRWIIVSGRPDAADEALLLEITELASLGYSRFAVASADHAFAPVAEAFPTTVIVRRGQPVSAQLRRAAEAVLAA